MSIRHAVIPILAPLVLLITLNAQLDAQASARSASKLATGYQTSCLRGSVVCEYINLDFTGKESVREHVTTYLPVLNIGEVSSWNRKQAKIVSSQTLHKIKSFHVEIKVPGTDAWRPISTNVECRYCIAYGKWNFEPSRKYWVKFDLVEVVNTRPAHSVWSFVRSVRKGEPLQFLVEVESAHGPTVYASLRSSGYHYVRSTAKTGHFHAMLNGANVPSTRPSYVVVSLLPSWRAFGREYTNAEERNESGSGELPEFHGTAAHIVGAAVTYIKSLEINYSVKFAGVLPRKSVSKILSTRSADCEGLVTLLHALLLKSGVKSDPVVLNSKGLPPLSFSVPGPWANHAILYVPALDKFIDITTALYFHGKVPFLNETLTWRNTADLMQGFVAFDTVTGSVVAVH